MPRSVCPPSPSGKILPANLGDYEALGNWCCQRKYKGSRCVIKVHGSHVEFFGKQGQRRSYQPSPALRDAILRLSLPSGENWLDGELMHPALSDTLVLFDVLYYGGKSLSTSTLRKRLSLLYNLFTISVDPDSWMGYGISSTLYVAHTWSSDFSHHYEEGLSNDLIEGLVIKDYDSLMGSCGTKPYDVNWQIRVRKPTPSYRF